MRFWLRENFWLIRKNKSILDIFRKLLCWYPHFKIKISRYTKRGISIFEINMSHTALFKNNTWVTIISILMHTYMKQVFVSNINVPIRPFSGFEPRYSTFENQCFVIWNLALTFPLVFLARIISVFIFMENL